MFGPSQRNGKPVTRYSFSSPTKEKEKPLCPNFHLKLDEFRHNGEHCDFHIRVQEERFPCHRIVLASSTATLPKYFRDIFVQGKYDQGIILHDYDSKAFEIALSVFYTNDHNINGQGMQENPFCSDFHSKLNELRLKEEYCDVNIRVQEKSFPCHRVVLASASEYFEAMFGGFFKEKHDKEIVLQDFDSTTFEDVITVVYTANQSIITTDNVHNLIHAASFLRIDCIEESCTEFILKNLSSIRDHLGIFRLARAMSTNARLTGPLSQHIVHNFTSFYTDIGFMEMPLDDLKYFLRKWVRVKLPFKHESLLLDLLIRWVHHAQEERKKYFKELVDVVDFEKISPQYITFMLKYFKNVDISNLENASGLNTASPIKKSVTESNLEVADSEDSGKRLLSFRKKLSKYFKKSESKSTLPDTENSDGNRLLLKEEISKYFAVNEEFASSDSEQVTSPFPNTEFYKNELGLHASFQVSTFNRNVRDKSGRRRVEGRKKAVFSLSKYSPDWFLSSEKYSYLCKEQYTVYRQSTDRIYCLEIFEDELRPEKLTWSFRKFSSMGMSLSGKRLTPPPIKLTLRHEFSMCATRNDIFLHNPHANYTYKPFIYRYNYEKDKWFPLDRISPEWKQGWMCSLTADDNLVYLFGNMTTDSVAFDYRVARAINIPRSTYEHTVRDLCCTMNGNIYVGSWFENWETYDLNAGKWRTFPGSRLKNIKEVNYDRALLHRLVPYENKLWCIAKYTPGWLIDPRKLVVPSYRVASYDPVSAEWYISRTLNDILVKHAGTKQNEKSSYSLRHDIKDIFICKTP